MMTLDLSSAVAESWSHVQDAAQFIFRDENALSKFSEESDRLPTPRINGFGPRADKLKACGLRPKEAHRVVWACALARGQAFGSAYCREAQGLSTFERTEREAAHASVTVTLLRSPASQLFALANLCDPAGWGTVRALLARFRISPVVETDRSLAAGLVALVEKLQNGLQLSLVDTRQMKPTEPIFPPFQTVGPLDFTFDPSNPDCPQADQPMEAFLPP
jgi:hypothetical protein